MNCCHYEDNHAGCIESVPIFKGLTRDEMDEIAHITTAKTYQKGEMVYMAGDKAGTLFVLHSGRVKVFRINANGKEQVIRVIGPGEFMGELTLFSSVPLTDNAEVLEASTMCVIKGDNLKVLMTKYTSIAFKIMEELSRRLERIENLVETINLNTVEQRVAMELLELSKGQQEIVLSMPKGDLASQIGMSQETLSRKLTAFQEEGLIKLIGRRRILIQDRAALEEKSRD